MSVSVRVEQLTVLVIVVTEYTSSFSDFENVDTVVRRYCFRRAGLSSRRWGAHASHEPRQREIQL